MPTNRREHSTPDHRRSPVRTGHLRGLHRSDTHREVSVIALMRNAVGAVQAALVLGGGSEIAHATMRKLVSSGCSTVVLGVRDPAAVARQVQELVDAGAKTRAGRRVRRRRDRHARPCHRAVLRRASRHRPRAHRVRGARTRRRHRHRHPRPQHSRSRRTTSARSRPGSPRRGSCAARDTARSWCCRPWRASERAGPTSCTARRRPDSTRSRKGWATRSSGRACAWSSCGRASCARR